MVIGILELEIKLFSSNSLKDKRRIIKSLTDRIRNNFNVSVSEIRHQDLWQRAGLGIALLTTEGRFAQRMLSKIVNFIKEDKKISLIDSKMEIM
ncbi:DUF503 domain-containing protein [Candidatus Aerophobetes bacterium]|jgi:uncharacterized protein YlxP (DUF503 family)|nr:DUF503 domain-containing protein [Candidatus Aerophobetes bacterium]TKJ44496.1 MAG: hypothetical protein CEE35_07780 [Candidatus Aerophobetes bacterium Ae_b3b]